MGNAQSHEQRGDGDGLGLGTRAAPRHGHGHGHGDADAGAHGADGHGGGGGGGAAGAGAGGRTLVDVRVAGAPDGGAAAAAGGAPQRRRPAVTAEAVEGGVLSVSGTLQALGGVIITALTIHKLVEEVRVMRALRRSARAGGAGLGGGARDERGDAPPSEQRLLPPLGSDAALGTLAGGAAGGGGGGGGDSWARVSGLREVKMLLQEATVLPLLRPDLFGGVREPPRGVLLYGPPGTGKTMLARAVAAESGAAFIPVTGSSVLSKWFGESEANVRRLFEDARRAAPAVIFIDEVDSLLGRRSGAGGDGPGGASEASRRVTNEFLSYIDGIHTGCGGASEGGSGGGGGGGRGGGSGRGGGGGGCGRGGDGGGAASSSPPGGARVVVIAATNAPWDLDEAALSRFAARVLVPLPDAPARADILRASMAGAACAMSEADWRRAAEATASYSGRDLMQVCREASMRPLRELWGNRVLEGGAPRHAQRQRQLVGAVAAALRRGVPRRRMRRELEKWRRAEDAAAWCDVDAVIAEAEAANAAADGVKSPRPLASKQVPPPPQRQAKQQQQQQDEEALGRGSGSGAGTPAERPQQQEQQQNQQDRKQDGEQQQQPPAQPPDTGSGGSQGQSGGGGGGGGEGGTWTVEELLSLPADSLRPVTLADFEAAIAAVSPTECDLAARFEEWSAKYGSCGATRRREDPWRSLPMYV
ncbi:hypothetical protein Rsub_01576 [Raphidocelis subcapitata]|uniref:AAA+ ATPase domain-containing protein n=1 Tax=Raphidocelis subcapitata TaxID=307507 RepID=A0A2V0NUR1_9CHLO|nr:hypothetical protein Rsub_01576 [Raphidocelis subcapitata]|eukprot:GBF88677.1 hypothetical protein Rsub_01576 [Raphidocelis subcapitata]